jgi:hypothetical protein
MKKIISIIGLLLVISATGIYSFLYIFFNLKNYENPINRTVRPYVIQSELFRKMFKLKQVGDARYEYVKNASIPISIHLYYQQGEALEKETLSKVLPELFRVTHKAEKIRTSEPTLLTDVPERVTNKDINRFLDGYSYTPSILAREVPLNIFVFHEYEQYPSYAGLVVDDHSIIIFKKIIENVSDHQKSPVSAEVSTILHEFAHLAGSEHIQNTECIMAEKMENINLFNKPSFFRDTYCPEDIEAIMKNF